jgi:hypothetical protein
MKKLFRGASLLAVSSLALMGSAATATECGAASGARHVALLELYTSEGCSSCPPADRWLSKLPEGNGEYVPLSFHVDYWDYIGWQDRFAQAKFTARQREMAAHGHSGLVYTPQFFFNGRDFRGAGDGFSRQAFFANRPMARAAISLDLKSSPGFVDLTTKTTSSETNAALYLALYESGLQSAVKAGENNGSTLRHAYVVREWLGPFPLDSRSTRIAIKPDWVLANMGAVAVVQGRGGGEVLQALSLKLCPN